MQKNVLESLRLLSQNFYWSWNVDAKNLFAELFNRKWDESNHNPVELLNNITEEEITKINSPEFSKRIFSAENNLNNYLNNNQTWASKNAKEITNPIAYFTSEFGFHESLRIYSGGLGILSGDHTKSASDLGLSFVGVSLFYYEGYFEQKIIDGKQTEIYRNANPKNLPLELVTKKNGERILCEIEIGNEKVFFQTWFLKVGKSKIYLLDTNISENLEKFKSITAHVYGGDNNTRIMQEILLGIGGVRLFRAIEIEPSCFHINEGHSAFLIFELLKEFTLQGVDLKNALEKIKSQILFTTHTPVPAGHDRFSVEMMSNYFSRFSKESKILISDLIALGKITNDINELFTMTVLALRVSKFANGVSKLHAEVSREMWKDLFKTEVGNVPIDFITNGIHVESWSRTPSLKFWENKFGQSWNEKFTSKNIWTDILKQVSDEEIWNLRCKLRKDLIGFVNKNYFANLNPDALTICFARRFATYKRAPLIFSEIEKIEKIFNNKSKPVQFIFSGKAHPKDEPGKNFINQINQFVKKFEGKVIFIENYNMHIARYLISGADVWLNNPRRPHEASGTSGQKIAFNGGLNCSILDGWWPEAFNGKNGFAIGNEIKIENEIEQDNFDSNALYEILSENLIPEFYERDSNGLPKKWIEKIRSSIETIIPQFNTDRMVAEYAEKFYLNLAKK